MKTSEAYQDELMDQVNEWTGTPAPEDPDNWWVDDRTGEYVNSITGARMSRRSALKLIRAN